MLVWAYNRNPRVKVLIRKFICIRFLPLYLVGINHRLLLPSCQQFGAAVVPTICCCRRANNLLLPSCQQFGASLPGTRRNLDFARQLGGSFVNYTYYDQKTNEESPEKHEPKYGPRFLHFAEACIENWDTGMPRMRPKLHLVIMI